MPSDQANTEAEFNKLFAEWKQATRDFMVQLSSKPEDYTNNEPYAAIVALGEAALPFLVEKLEEGEFLLYRAILDILGVRLEELVARDLQFESEQRKSEELIEWWRRRIGKQ